MAKNLAVSARFSAIVFVFAAASACSGGGNGSGGTQVVPPSAGAGPTFTVGGSPATFSEFPITPGDAVPNAITVALDGNAWFMSGLAVNRITQSGTVTRFTDPFFSQFDQAYSEGTAITVGPDRALWFTARCAVDSPVGCDPLQMYLGRITTTGSITVPGTVPVSSTFNAQFESGLVSGSDGNIWAEGAGSSRGGLVGDHYQSVTLSGTVVLQKDLPLACPVTNAFIGNTAAGIVHGTDGAIYVAANGQGGPSVGCSANDVVFRIDSSGSITNTLVVSETGGFMTGIAVGPDGNFWITGLQKSIIRMTPTGQVTQFPIPSGSSQARGITAGNDGAMWFTEFDTSKIGRITTAGVITEYSTPTANAGPSGIASLPGECGPGHGRIWFTELNANKIGRIDF